MQVHNLLLVVVLAWGNGVNGDTNNNLSVGPLLLRKQRDVTAYWGLVACAMKYDVSCFLDGAQNYLDGQKTELLGKNVNFPCPEKRCQMARIPTKLQIFN